MYRIKVKASFSAAHRVREEGGQCENLHGHNWEAEVTVAGPRLDKTGMVVNFREVREKLNAILKAWDHAYLNELADFKKNNPTSENLARIIFQRLKRKINNRRMAVEEVAVRENATSEACYREIA